MLKVYNYMTSGIFLTGIISLFLFKLSVVVAPDGSIAGLTSVGNALYNSALMWIVMLAPLGVVIYMSFGIRKMSAAKAQMNFLDFCSFNGSLPFINIFGLHRREYHPCIFHYRWNFWSNEYLWLHNKKRFNKTRFISYDGSNRNYNCINSEYIYEIYNDVFRYFYSWSFNICWLDCLRYTKN